MLFNIRSVCVRGENIGHPKDKFEDQTTENLSRDYPMRKFPFEAENVFRFYFRVTVHRLQDSGINNFGKIE